VHLMRHMRRQVSHEGLQAHREGHRQVLIVENNSVVMQQTPGHTAGGLIFWASAQLLMARG